MRVLIEIGVEELPAIPFLKEEANIPLKWNKILSNYNINSNFKFEYTPRRLVLFSDDFPKNQDDITVESIGAPKAVALKDGSWTKAAISFANKCGISVDELEFKNIKDKEVLYHLSVKKGSNTKELLGDIINEFLKDLNFGKSMRWGDKEYEFIRPIRSIICMVDDENVDMEIYGVRSDKSFYPHRSFGYEKIEFSSFDEYFNLLPKYGITLKASKRKEMIESDILEIEKKYGLKVEKDDSLLAEIVAITEHPKALLGKFDESFLEVPKEVIITSMKENQRYFPVFKDEKLSNNFVVVSNGVGSDESLVIAGNERVLRARLSDAMFFWESDLKSKFSPEPLKNISYMSELGTVYDKELRELEVAKSLAKIYDSKLESEFGGDYKPSLEKAIMLSKADLATGMVGEFGELQGIMGSYYAKDENEFVSTAIKEQYLYDEIPSTLFGAVVNMATKLESMFGLFSINKEPTGTKDPFALRRAALSIIKIVLAKDLNFDIKAIAEENAKNYANFKIQNLVEFFMDRLNSIYPDVNASIINACLKSGETDFKKLNSAILALDEISKADSFKEKFSTFKRLANIIKDETIDSVDDGLLKQSAELELYGAYKGLDLEVKDYKNYLNQLFNLKNEIDAFFDSVMINVDDEKIRNNRIALVGAVYKAFLKVADIKEISI
ncbi:glycine--tRNA ligase subunit beta [Campylobacter corcagiensis]|uniref:Glycine--tRNA ligase beta subunit n=1 Tax=Campylobacter corcagiensis TaxID=1448857 RepID=A0A7M1LFA0_9BACT|nr:glycine--tRNA ligase subunit beta [Campylobacter corcagiensis]QKF64835.1 glycyl-tRNA synthetase, beta chain [Campylobacter corcagiensis]QOQ87003.1 glycine--tRNA ligase subunit beta [Campylobacter corcagiensis]